MLSRTFVGAALSAHLDEFGRYPANKGSEPFRHAVAQWLGRRYKLARPVDAEQRSAGALGHARGPVPGGDRRQALGRRARGKTGGADPQSVLCRLRRRRRGCRLRAGLSAGDAGNRFPARSRRARRGAAGAHRRFLPRLALEPARRRRQPRLSRPARRARPPLRLPGVRRRMLLRDLQQAAAARHAGSLRPRFRAYGGVPFAVEALEPARLARRLCRRRPPLPFSLSRIAQRRGAAGAGPGAARRHRRLQR